MIYLEVTPETLGANLYELYQRYGLNKYNSGDHTYYCDFNLCITKNMTGILVLKCGANSKLEAELIFDTPIDIVIYTARFHLNDYVNDLIKHLINKTQIDYCSFDIDKEDL